MRKTSSRLNGKSSFKTKLTRKIFSVLTAAQIVIMPLAFNGNAFAANNLQQDSPAAIIFDNGGLATGATANNGTTAAPTGTQWSEAQNDFGITTQANTLAGVGCQQFGTTSNRCADDFNVPVGQTWTINQVIVFAYLTGFTGTASPITGANLRIWRGAPGAAGSTVVFGDTTTNHLASSTDAGLFRIFNSVVPAAPATTPTAPGTTRRIWQVNINVSPALVLTAGNYWIDFQTQATNAGALVSHFHPTISYRGTRGVPGWNALQSVNGGTSWQASVDAGQAPVNAPIPYEVRQDFPFKLDGTIAGAPAFPRRRTMDFNGDNRSDLVVVRSANATSPSTWWIANAGETIGTSRQWGVGVGFTGGDIATPEDFDGDGRTDIAVWRAGGLGDPTRSYFFIFQSGSSTVRSEPFGATGDDPTVVEDYDGDGRADLAVYRAAGAGTAGVCGANSSVWYYRPSNTPSVNYRYACWGAAGDKVYPGDFDGDGRADFANIRDNGGQAVHYQNRTTEGVRVIPYGMFSDRFLSGDYDADGRTDLAAVRVSGTSFNWFITKSANNELFSFTFGNSATDFHVPGDYDGDNETDFALWRSGQAPDQTYFILRKTASSPLFSEWGQSAGPLTPPDYPAASSVNVH